MLFLLVYRPSKNLTNEVSSHTYCLAVKLHVESCYRPATDPPLSLLYMWRVVIDLPLTPLSHYYTCGELL